MMARNTRWSSIEIQPLRKADRLFALTDHLDLVAVTQRPVSAPRPAPSFYQSHRKAGALHAIRHDQSGNACTQYDDVRAMTDSRGQDRCGVGKHCGCESERLHG